MLKWINNKLQNLSFVLWRNWFVFVVVVACFRIVLTSNRHWNCHCIKTFWTELSPSCGHSAVKRRFCVFIPPNIVSCRRWGAASASRSTTQSEGGDPAAVCHLQDTHACLQQPRPEEGHPGKLGAQGARTTRCPWRSRGRSQATGPGPGVQGLGPGLCQRVWFQHGGQWHDLTGPKHQWHPPRRVSPTEFPSPAENHTTHWLTGWGIHQGKGFVIEENHWK